MEKPFTRVGKQIMASGSHYADAADETAAQFMLDALNTKAFGITESLLEAAKLAAAYDDLLLSHAGPQRIIFSNDVAELDQAYDRFVAAARAAIARATGAAA